MSTEMNKKKHNHRNVDRAVILLVSLVLVLGVAIGGTLGYLTGQVKVTNTMEVGNFTTEIEENLTDDPTVKKDVKVKNTGDYNAYVRAVVVVTWQNSDGDVYPETPAASTDYNITYGQNWTEHNGFYYYNGVVPAGQATSALIDTCTPVEDKAPEGYDLNVEILASSIQAEPEQAVKEAWGMEYNADTQTWSNS